MTNWTLVRDEQHNDAVHGLLMFGDDEFICFTLENADYLIACGTYPVVLTVSGRASRGELWTPRDDKRLPLIDVPGRSGIRVHAANQPGELRGCVAPGMLRHHARITGSRTALVNVMDRLTASSDVVLTVREASAHIHHGYERRETT